MNDRASLYAGEDDRKKLRLSSRVMSMNQERTEKEDKSDQAELAYIMQ